MAAIARNNAFGAGSPSWNLSFPDGNLTAAEILAYLPHWLKSVDVILRLVEHGGRAVIITYLLNKYRIMPSKDFRPNSTTVMVQYAMRRAGRRNWSIGTRDKFSNDRNYDENSIYVGDFRPPRLTHPKSASTKQKSNVDQLARNCAAEPIPFKDLALHVKEHPSGDDALDLTRCVRYALKHPKEEWLFPTDFVALVKHIGGPLPVTHSHLDRQLFGRYNHLYGEHDPSRPPANWNRTKGKRQRKSDDTETGTEIDSSSDNVNEDDLVGESNTGIEVKVETETKPNLEGKKSRTKAVKSSAEPYKPVIRQARSSAMAGTNDQIDGSHDDGGKRRSSCRVKKPVVYTEKDEDAMDTEPFDSDFTTPRKKRRVSRIPPTPKDEESDFEAKEEPESEDDLLPSIDDAADEDFGTPTAARGRRLASCKARQNIQEQSPAVIMEQFSAIPAAAMPVHKTFVDHDCPMMAAARAWDTRKPLYIPAPVLSRDRLVIDTYTLPLYAQEGCRNENEMWASALSFYRFGGPRRHAPFRELYRLTEPYAWDTSDWAENVRWAKEQYQCFGVKTWTEYDYHLDYIQQIRFQTLWVSEEAVQTGVW
ncbi:hypothetical protein E8E12_000656 [Didymella heteroderae]|uniref:Uncharacterized protein n=1 Tax=Didymella heteroderae TaxID=1769908 RepID=A0A9P4WUL2_9PLEO|nr:hypothetical protein E8E12_000656 [Didymella heteroderae]